MAEALPEIVRTISGKGIITIPEDYFSALQIYLYVQVLREPLNPSRNYTWNPDRSFYAHIAFCIDDFVLREEDVNFNSQVYELHNGQESQNLLSLICAYDGILDSFVSVGNVIGVTLSRTNLIKSHPYLRSQINRIRFECFADSALVLTLRGTSLDKCALEDGDSTPPPPPPLPVELVPPGEPVMTSPAEDGDNDGGDTLPFPGDEPDLPIFPGEPCQRYLVRYSVSGSGVSTPGIRETVLASPIIAFEIRPNDADPNTATIYAECNGLAGTGGECGGVTSIEVDSDVTFQDTLTIISIELSP
jgi:hypothetical protein